MQPYHTVDLNKKMIKENTTHNNVEPHYFKQSIDQLPEKTVRKIMLQRYAVQIIGFSMSDILLKKNKR